VEVGRIDLAPRCLVGPTRGAPASCPRQLTDRSRHRGGPSPHNGRAARTLLKWPKPPERNSVGMPVPQPAVCSVAPGCAVLASSRRSRGTSRSIRPVQRPAQVMVGVYLTVPQDPQSACARLLEVTPNHSTSTTCSLRRRSSHAAGIRSPSARPRRGERLSSNPTCTASPTTGVVAALCTSCAFGPRSVGRWPEGRRFLDRVPCSCTAPAPGWGTEVHRQGMGASRVVELQRTVRIGPWHGSCSPCSCCSAFERP
jgi:hypothetical protein